MPTDNADIKQLERPRVAKIDEILGVPFKVLDAGFVRVVDYMGSDESIVQAARVSYGRGTKMVHEDRGLIRTLKRNREREELEEKLGILGLQIPWTKKIL